MRRRNASLIGETWQVARVLLRTWVREPGAAPRRPWVTMVVSVPGELILGSEIIADKPAPDMVLSVLEHTMAHPHVGRSRRPVRILCPEPELVTELASYLAANGIACTLGETPELREAVTSLEEHLRGRPLIPGLLESPGVTTQQVGRLFAAAAFYYRAAPWRFLSDAHPIAVRIPSENATARYAVVLGNGGIEFGLAVYRSPEQLAALYAGVPPEVLVGAAAQEGMTYGEPPQLAFADLDAVDRYGWEVAGPHAYPLPLVFTKKREVKRPSADDLRWYEASLWAIPRFVTEYLKPKADLVRLAEATLRVPLAEGDVAVNLRYPPDYGQRTP